MVSLASGKLFQEYCCLILFFPFQTYKNPYLGVGGIQQNMSKGLPLYIQKHVKKCLAVQQLGGGGGGFGHIFGPFGHFLFYKMSTVKSLFMGQQGKHALNFDMCKQ